MEGVSVNTPPSTPQGSMEELQPATPLDVALDACSVGWIGVGIGIDGSPMGFCQPPEYPEKYGRFYSPEEAFYKLKEAAHMYGVNKLRISGAEPTLGKEHLLDLLEHVEESEFPLFILETNGILFGIDKNYVRSISKFTKPHVRISIKAGTPEAFARKTGAKPEAFKLPFQAIRTLLDHNVSFHVAAMSADPRFMPPDERTSLIERLVEIDPQLLLSLEEEVVDDCDTTLARLRLAGWRVKWPLKRIYTPVKELLKKRHPRRGL